MNEKDPRLLMENGLIVSCHSDTDEPYFSIDLLLAYAKAAEMGGAAGLRIESVEAVAAVRKQTTLPIIGFVKGKFDDGSDLITPDFLDIEKLFEAGADVVAVDCTKRKRSNGMDGFVFLEEARRRFPQYLWADCSVFREGIKAAECGVDFVATTLSGYTPGTSTKDYRTPDYTLIHELSLSLTIPVIAEGRMWTPDDAAHALSLGAFAVVVGSAITRPKIITRMFVDSLIQQVSELRRD